MQIKSLNMKINFLAIGVIMILFVSCAKDSDIHYLDHSKWFIYEEHDTLIFRSGLLIDTYRISQIINTHEIIDKKEGDEILAVYYEGITGCENCPIQGFTRKYDRVIFIGDIKVGSFYYESTPGMNYQMGDTLLEEIYIVDDIPVDDPEYYKVKAIYYSDIFGIIRYDMYDDRVYELQIE